jgi:hypothetical protein
MSFQPIQFNYTPPATISISTANMVSANATKINSSIGGSTIIAPLANSAIANLEALREASDYLQTLIVIKYAKYGITIDSNSDPVTGQALAACYNGTIPPIVTTGMFNNLLDCQIALQSINQAVGINSTIQADPIMLSNVTQINNAVTSSLLTDGGSDQLAIQCLAVLKGNSQLFSNLALSLGEYTTTTDISPGVSSGISTLINNETSLLSSLYSLQTQVNVINQDINNVLNAYVVQPLEDITRITAAINLLTTLTYKKEAKKIFDGLSTVLYSQLLSEATASYLAIDQIAQRVLAPLKGMVGSLGSILNTVNSGVKSLELAENLAKTTITNITQPGIPGFSNCNPCSQQILGGLSNSKLPNVPGFKGLSSGLQFLGQHISAGQNQISSEFNTLESAFTALQLRRNKDFATVLQVMCAMQASESLVSIGTQVINLKQQGTIPAQAPTSTSSISPAIATQLSNNVLSATPIVNTSSLPAMSTSVSSILLNGVIQVPGALNA